MKTVLIVEDDPHLNYLLSRYGKQCGWRIISTGQGDSVLPLVAQESPTLIVLEANLSATTGWDVLQILKTQPETSNIPVVMCSWLEEEPRSREAGAAGYLQMPVQYTDFVTIVQQAQQNYSTL